MNCHIKESYDHMLRSASSMLKVLLFVLIAITCFAQSGGTPGAPPASAATAAPSNAAEDDDSADIPAFARGAISEQQYLEARDKEIRTRRGIDDLVRDPGARSQAIRTMQLQEQFLRTLQTSFAGAPGTLPPAAATWSPLGPAPIPNGQTTAVEVAVSGRVTAIVVDPANANLVYVGTAQGGVYRSSDGGNTWTPLMDSALSLAIGSITIDPTNSNTLFVGTGEGNFSGDSFFGVGLYIIQNATAVTPTISGPFNSNGTSDVFTGRSITRILVNPANNNQILVATSSGFSGLSGDTFSTLPTRGVYVSSNALSGTPTFTRLTVQTAVANRAVTDMVMDPGNANTVLVNVFGIAAANDGGIWVTNNAWAATPAWTQVLTKQAGGRFAVNRVGSTTTFLAALDEFPVSCPANGSSKEGLVYRSTNTTTWTPITATTGFCGGQCIYDMAPAMPADNASTILLGGSANGGSVATCGTSVMIRSIDGTNFSRSDNSLHADSHATTFAPSNSSVVYAGNDGGIFRSNDGGQTWSSLNTTGFNATQFVSLSLHPTDPNFTIGGTQDNGTPFMRPDGTWTRADFGDGGYSAIDQSSTDTTNVTMYHTYFNATGALIGFAEVSNVSSASEGLWNFFGCGSGNVGNNGIGCADAVLFYAPLALGPGSPNTVYFGTDRLYRSVDRGVTNVAVSQTPISAGVPISSIGVSPQDDNVRIVGLANGQVFATATGSTTLSNVTGGWAARFVARTLIDPNDSNTAYVTLDGYGTAAHVWKTTNLSSVSPTWTSVSNGLPDVPVNAFAVDPFNPSYLYAGTDIGVFSSSDAGASWAPYGTGLPRVAVFDLNIQKSAHKIRIGTHGRGAWEIAASTFTSTTVLVASSNTPLPGTPVTLTATVNRGTGIPAPGGTVTFSEGETTLGTGSVNSSGVGAFTTSSLLIGPHNIIASYGGDTLYASSNSTAILVDVETSGAATTTAISASVSSITLGGSVSFTATIDKGAGTATPTGTVIFRDGAISLGSAPLNGSAIATLTTTALGPGVRHIIAVYGGDSTYGSSPSAAATVTVVTPTTTLIGASSTNPVQGTTITLTATINISPGTTPPTGTVTFKDGATVMGSPVVNASGIATLQTSSLALGPHNITAVYSGDSLYTVSTSSAIVVTVVAGGPPDFSVNISNASQAVAAGQSASYTFTVTPQNGFSGIVSFTCSGLPQAANCSFNPPTVTGSGSTTLTISTTVRTFGAPSPANNLGAFLVTGAGFFGLVLLGGFSSKKRRLQFVGMVLLALGMMMAMVSCGGGSSQPRTPQLLSGTPAGASTVTVTETSGAATHTSTITLNVQ